MTFTLFLFIALLAAAIASITGFGTATILTPFAGLIIDLKQAIVLVAFFHFFSNLFRLLRLRSSISFRLLLLFGLPSIATAYIGAILFGQLDVELISVIFAVFIIIFAVYSFIRPKWSLPDKKGVLIFGGALSGLTAGLIGLGGAIRSMFLISTNISKEAYIATSAAIAVLVDMTRISMYLYNSNLDSQYYIYVIPLIAMAFIGTLLGVKLLAKLPELVVKRSVLVMLLIVAIVMLVD